MKKVKKDISYFRSILGIVLRPRLYKKRIMDELATRLPYKPCKSDINWCYRDFFRFFVKYRGDLETDYFASEIFRKSEFTRRESLANYSRFAWRDFIQDKEKYPIFEDKIQFYSMYSSYLNRKWMIVDVDTTLETCKDFIESCQGRSFVKMPISCGGKDVHLADKDNLDIIPRMLKKSSNGRVIIEEALSQSNDLFSFSGSAVNTIRIVTLVDDLGEVQIATALFRIGRSDHVVDNFSSGGICAAIDIESGVVIGLAMDRKSKQYIFHPDTGKKIVGYQIEDWIKYKEFATELAKQCKSVRYVGWDIIKDINGTFCIIEGNKNSGIDLVECRIQYGIRPYYEALLKRDTMFQYDMIH